MIADLKRMATIQEQAINKKVVYSYFEWGIPVEPVPVLYFDLYVYHSLHPNVAYQVALLNNDQINLPFVSSGCPFRFIILGIDGP